MRISKSILVPALTATLGVVAMGQEAKAAPRAENKVAQLNRDAYDMVQWQKQSIIETQEKINRLSTAQFEAYTTSLLRDYARMLTAQLNSGEPLSLGDDAPIRGYEDLIKARAAELGYSEYYFLNFEEQLVTIQLAYVNQLALDWNQTGNTVAGTTALNTNLVLEGLADPKYGKKARAQFDESAQKVQTLLKQKQKLEERLANIKEMKEDFKPALQPDRLSAGQRVLIEARLFFNANLSDEELLVEMERLDGELQKWKEILLAKDESQDVTEELMELNKADLALVLFSECAQSRIDAQSARAGSEEVSTELAELFASELGVDATTADEGTVNMGPQLVLGNPSSNSDACSDADIMASEPTLRNTYKPDHLNKKASPDWVQPDFVMHQQRYIASVGRLISADLYKFAKKHENTPATRNFMGDFDFDASFSAALSQATEWTDGSTLTDEAMGAKINLYDDQDPKNRIGLISVGLNPEQVQWNFDGYEGMRNHLLQRHVSRYDDKMNKRQLTLTEMDAIAMDGMPKVFEDWRRYSVMGMPFEFDNIGNRPCEVATSDEQIHVDWKMVNPHANAYAQEMCSALNAVVGRSENGMRFVQMDGEQRLWLPGAVQSSFAWRLEVPNVTQKDELLAFALTGTTWDLAKQEHARAAEGIRYEVNRQDRRHDKTGDAMERAAGKKR